MKIGLCETPTRQEAMKQRQVYFGYFITTNENTITKLTEVVNSPNPLFSPLNPHPFTPHPSPLGGKFDVVMSAVEITEKLNSSALIVKYGEAVPR